MTWELVEKETAKGTPSTGFIYNETHRMKVPGGWLVRVQTVSEYAAGMPNIFPAAPSFLSDPSHQWALKAVAPPPEKAKETVYQSGPRDALPKN